MRTISPTQTHRWIYTDRHITVKLDNHLRLLDDGLQFNRLTNLSGNIGVFKCYRNDLVLFDWIVRELYPAFHNRENGVVPSHHGVISMVIFLSTLSNYYVTWCNIFPTILFDAQSASCRVSPVLTGTTGFLGGESNGLKVTAHLIDTSTNLANTVGHG